MRKRNGSGAGFTLIELLVVITIIGLLAAIIVPSIIGALGAAKKARAMSEIKDLDGAIKRYNAEYNRMPVPSADMTGGADKLYSGREQSDLILVLINANDALNPKQIAFLEINPASFGVKTAAEMQAQLANGEPYRDPWGNEYGILLDLNFDDKITGAGGFEDILAKVGVYSGGQNGNAADPPYKTW